MAIAIKAIETLYNGCRFRSRLEARWAVFFDTLGIPWEYEKEGYVLDKGIRYLPDFWLPSLTSWIEIKGEAPTEKEIEKAYLLSQMTLCDVYIFHGMLELPSVKKPYMNTWYFTTDVVNSALGTSYVDGIHGWAQCPWCLQFGITYESRVEQLRCGCYRYIEPFMVLNQPLAKLRSVSREMAHREPLSNLHAQLKRPAITDWWSGKCAELLYAGDSPLLVAAYTAARQARFDGRSTP